MAFKPSPAQKKFYEWVKNDHGHCILNAVAGAGKTTTIMNGITLMPGSVFMGVYNKKMADELKEKINENEDLKKRAAFGNRQDPLTTSTFHSLGFGIVKSFNGRDNETKIDDKKVERIVDDLIAEREGADQQERPDLRELKSAVLSVVSMAKNRGMGRLCNADDSEVWLDMIEHFDLDSALPDEYNQATLLKFAKVALGRSNKDTHTLDFDDMVYLPLLHNMRPKPWHQFDWVLVDEAQDTNPTRRALASMVMKRGARLVAVGDPHQAIFGFTGADNDSLQQIADAFGAKELPLTVSYRCPFRVVEHARQWVSHIESHENAPEGSVSQMPYDELLAHLKPNDCMDPNETAILCRYNKPLVGLCFKLIREGIPAKIEGRSIGENLIKMAKRWKSIKTVNGLETKIRDYQEREVAKALKKEQEAKADRITDETETLLTLIERARAEGKSTIAEMCEIIEDMFADNVAGKGLLTLCSAHKSKGLEWNDVYLLGREDFMPSKFARQQWQLDQETNLIYVAVTRAKANLIEVTNVKEEKDPTNKL